jgi:hypothetical protein
MDEENHYRFFYVFFNNKSIKYIIYNTLDENNNWKSIDDNQTSFN